MCAGDRSRQGLWALGSIPALHWKGRGLGWGLLFDSVMVRWSWLQARSSIWLPSS